MAKAAIVRKYALNATGILHIDDANIGIENTETGELVNLSTLATDFNGKECRVSVTYDEDI